MSTSPFPHAQSGIRCRLCVEEVAAREVINSDVPRPLPINALFVFESETTGLTFVRHRWPQSLRWQLFSWFPREDQAADYKCGHSQSKAHKLQWVHVVCPSPDTTEQYGSPLILAIFCKSSGSVAMFTAIRHASSLVSIWKTPRPRYRAVAQTKMASGLRTTPTPIAIANESTLPIKASILAVRASLVFLSRCQPNANLSATQPPMNVGR